ncbi:MAG: anaerobic ribonucleoside-triphosphate reductase [candidate division WOR-3 bacterium]|jgi:anaerobic ribonucleoside-triphosphate reductase
MEENTAERKESSKEKVRAVRAEVYSRVVGYYRPVAAWNEGKREEFKDRNYLSRDSGD